MTEPTANLESVLSKVRKMIERADHPGTPEAEAEVCRAKADRMMLDYAITEAEIDATRPAALRVVPETTSIDLCEASHPLSRFYADLVQNIALHCRARVVFYNLTDAQKTAYGRTNVTAVGFPSDLRYLELLFTVTMLHMSGEMEPSPDPAKSFDENVYVLHEAGVSWRRIVHLMLPDVAKYDEPEVRKAGGKCKTAYRRYCARTGETPTTIVSPVTYQRNFAEGYVSRISTRLYEMRRANGSVGTALALRTADVDSKFDELYPDLKFMKHKEHRYDHNARMAGREAGDRADLSGKNKVGSKRRELS